MARVQLAVMKVENISRDRIRTKLQDTKINIS
jgi:hypothetical protein